MNIISFPILFPLFLILVLLFVGKPRAISIIGVTGGFSLLAASGYIFLLINIEKIIVVQVGGWEAPFGITLVVDGFSSIMLLVSSFIIAAISLYALPLVNSNKLNSKFYIFLFSLSIGVNGSFITGDVFNLYVWFELMLLSSFVLISMGYKKKQLEGSIKYMALNLFASLLFLAGIGILYGKTGTLNMAHLSEILTHNQKSILINTSAMLFFIAFGIKAALFPLFFWLPSSYYRAEITITALFAGLLTKVGVYAFIRFFTLFFVHDKIFWHNLLLILAGSTMLIGGMAASKHYDTRRILSYHIISQIGYMIMGLGIFTPLAIAGSIFFIIHNMIAKTNTILVAGLIKKLKGSYDIRNIGDLYKEKPLVAILFIIPAFALMGLPPLSGFFAKFILIKAGFEDQHFVVTSVAILTSMLTLFSMIKIWNEAFLKKSPTDKSIKVKLKPSELIPSVMLGLASIALGVFAKYIFDYTMKAANQLINHQFYIDSVLK